MHDVAKITILLVSIACVQSFPRQALENSWNVPQGLLCSQCTVSNWPTCLGEVSNQVFGNYS